MPNYIWGIDMKKRSLLLVCFLVSKAFAGGIVYVDEPKVLSSSSSIALGEKQIDANYQKKRQDLLKQQAQLSKSKKSNDEIAAANLILQDKFNQITDARDKQVKTLRDNYAKIQLDVMKQLQKSRKYDYILSIGAVFAADETNNITQEIVKLSDDEYKKKYK